MDLFTNFREIFLSNNKPTTVINNRSNNEPVVNKTQLTESARLIDKKLQSLFNKNQHVVSSFSIASLLSVLSLGSTGKTHDELVNFLGDKSGISNELLIDMKRILETSENKTIVSTNYGFFVKSIRDMNPDFYKFCNTLGKCDPLTDVETINEWVSVVTRGLIKGLLSPDAINSATKIIAVNTIYFKSLWMEEFDPMLSSKMTFTNQNGKKINGKFMTHDDSLECRFPYYEDKDVRILQMNYINDDFCFDIILPTDFKKWRGDIYDYVNELETGRQPRVKVYIPKFRMKSKISMKDFLQNSGCGRIFRHDCNDFTKMFSKTGDIGIDEIIHEAVIIVDEKGTEAAAATACCNELCMIHEEPEITFVAKTPFYFYIRHRRTNTVLFSGIFDGDFKNDLD